MPDDPLRRIHLLAEANPMPAEVVLRAVPDGPVAACDFHVEGITRGEEAPGGYRLGRLLNVDHHAPTPRMARRVSSTNLAIAQVAAEPGREYAGVVLNHTDCDSVLSAGIMAGLLPPEPRFGEAAVAADHTGEEDAVADLLQSLERLRDFELSLRSLRALMERRPLEAAAEEGVKRRERRRAAAERFVAEGRFHAAGPVTFAVLDHAVDGAFFPALLPGACVILLAVPMDGRPDRWEAKLRLGTAAPPGFSLHDLGIGEFDPAFGGRWNAGANRRAGGTALPVERYAAELAVRAARRLDELGAAPPPPSPPSLP